MDSASRHILPTMMYVSGSNDKIDIMRIRFLYFTVFLMLSGYMFLMTSCKKDKPFVFTQEDIVIEVPEGGFTIKVNQLLRIFPQYPENEKISFEWKLDERVIAYTPQLEYMFEVGGNYVLVLKASHGQQDFLYEYNVKVIFEDAVETPEGATAYITKVLDYMPAVGQFTNKLPEYSEGDTQEIMNRKVLDAIGNNNKGMITLGGFGGYVVVGFDHTILNVKGKRDFRVLGNAFYAAANPDPDAPDGGSCEPGVIMVAYDANKDGVPNDNEWYEIAGSSHIDHTKEPWYQKAVDAGCNVSLYRDYEITYYRPEKEPSEQDEWNTYIRWKDNQGNEGYKVKNQFHAQPYYPLWASGDRITFKGTCLPQNGIDESGQGNYFVLYKFLYGYADNEINTADDSAIDISWAVNSKGQYVELPGIDFVKIYTGVNQENGWLGECSTEITGIEDLHILGIDIDTRR